MKSFKLLAAAAVMAVSSFAANSEIINIGGVSWDTEVVNDFYSQQSIIRQSINPLTGELTGYGLVSGFNGTGVETFCPTCEMTFQFSGFLPTGGTVIPGLGQTISYTGGLVNIYVGPREVPVTSYNDYTALNATNTSGTPAQLFLQLQNNYTFLGTNLGSLLVGQGVLDVIGGFASVYFDTDSADHGADLSFGTTFTRQIVQGSILDMVGTSNLDGTTIPEPSSLAILGLGLLGLAGAARRKQAK